MKLVLEGGGVRSAYSAGICKALVDRGVRCEAVVGSSSGSVNAAFFAAGQTDALVELWTDYVPDGFISWRRQLNPFAGPGLGVDIMLDDVIVKEGKLDLEAATAGDPALFVTATDVDGCKPTIARPSRETLIEWLRASLAIPAAYNRVVQIDGHGYIDGGVATPVPFDIAELDAFEGPTVVVLTRKMTTKKRPMNWYERAFLHTIVPRRARSATVQQHTLHNATMQRLGKAMERGEVIVSNPPDEMPIARLTRDRATILDGVKLGLLEGARLAELLKSAD
jgi:predicted patatin/cPLA2 family phospholipase